MGTGARCFFVWALTASGKHLERVDGLGSDVPSDDIYICVCVCVCVYVFYPVLNVSNLATEQDFFIFDQ